MCLVGSVEIQVEVIPVVINGLGVHYTAHDRQESRWLRWLYSTDAHPMQVAAAMLTHAWGEADKPRVLHGTSWRYAGGGITLTLSYSGYSPLLYCHSYPLPPGSRTGHITTGPTLA